MNIKSGEDESAAMRWRRMTRLAVLFTFLAACRPTTGEIAAVTEPREPVPVAVPPEPTAPAPTITSPSVDRMVQRIGSPVILARAPGGTLAYVADEDAGMLRVVDVDRQDEIAAVALPGKPAQLLMLDDRRLVATLRDRDALVVLAGTGLTDNPLRIDQTIAMPSEPIGLALSPDDRRLLVTSGWGHSLTMVAVPAEPAQPLAIARTWDVAAEPRAVVVSDDNRYAFVSHMAGQGMERVDLTARTTKTLWMTGAEEVGEGPGEGSPVVDRMACQGYALAKLEPAAAAPGVPTGRILALQVQAATGNASEQSEGYGGGGADAFEPEVLDVAVIDEDKGEVLTQSLVLHRVFNNTRCALPRAAATASTGTLYVTCLGENTVLALDGTAATPINAQLARWNVPAGPTGIALDEANARAIVWSQHAQTLATFSTAPDAKPVARNLVLDHTLSPQLARGRELFAAVDDRRISKTGQACMSCHPDGRQDTLVWSSPNGPRQTPMLAGRLGEHTAPFGWSGDGKTVAKHVAQTFKRLGGTGLEGEDLDALLAYVMSLQAPGQRADTRALVAEGREVFESAEAQCASCHGEDGRSPDGMRHDVKSWARGDRRRDLDTPSLAFVGNTAPYYHDGRFETLRALLEKTHMQMGQTKKLSAHELDALEAYLRTL